MASNRKYPLDVGIMDYYDQYKLDYNMYLTNINKRITQYEKSHSAVTDVIRRIKNSSEKVRHLAVKRKINNKLVDLKIIKNELKKRRRVSDSLYGDILRIYYSSINEQLLKGYNWRLGYGLGCVDIVKRNNMPHRTFYGEYMYNIDWAATKLKKQELLDKGIKQEEFMSLEKIERVKLKYIKQGYEEVEARILAKQDSESGINYFQYRLYDHIYTVIWKKGMKDNMPNKRLYSFIPTNTFAKSIALLRHRTDIEGVFRDKTGDRTFLKTNNVK